MIWKTIAFFGAGSFFYVGLSILSDPLCQSVSFQGGGARTIATTCMQDGSGDFSRGAAINLLFIGGTVLFALLFRNYLIRLYHQFRLQFALQQASKDIDASSITAKQEELISLELEQPTPQATKFPYKSKNILIAGLILVLLVPAYKVIAPKISLLNPITCASLKRDLAAKDVLGRQIWNSYQIEVSRIGLIDEATNIDLWINQISNTERRANQMINDELARYQFALSRQYCVKVDIVNYLITQDNKSLDFFAGKEQMSNGRYWSPDWGWPTNFHKGFIESTEYLK
jgi:hypothetical protein